MASRDMARHLAMTRRIEEVAGIRPLTLLVASGMALVIVILVVTGIAANHLRAQALSTAASELARIDSVLAAAANRSLSAVDSQLRVVAERVGSDVAAGAGLPAAAAASDVAATMDRQVARFPKLDALALIDGDGQVLRHVGSWAADNSVAEGLLAALRRDPARASVVGAPLRNRNTGALTIPVALRVDGPQRVLSGAVVGMVPVDTFTSLFAAAPLPRDGSIVLLRLDGSVLARHPENPGAAGDEALGASHVAGLGGLTETLIRQIAATGDGWRIEAVRPLADFPIALAVSRDGGQVLAEWAHQILWFAAFALVMSLAVALAVYLVARQFQTHAALADMREKRIEAEKLESERARLAAEAELLKRERLSVLGQLTATVAHELRNPLSAIRNTLFTVKELAAGSAVKLDRPIGRMERSIERCDRIISDLLEYTRNRPLNRTPICFDRWVADMLAEQSLPSAIVVTSELSAGETVLPIDTDRVRRVLVNLVENAAQALNEAPADRDKRIEVRTAVVEDELVLTVEDTGPGIPRENLERIFEPLFSTKSFGTGLGLPTVKQIVNQHGGTIAVDSEVGRGTCVTVRLPLHAAGTEQLKVAA